LKAIAASSARAKTRNPRKRSRQRSGSDLPSLPDLLIA
jgi:hypothetical protein